jgi:hypothetical protein
MARRDRILLLATDDGVTWDERFRFTNAAPG